MLVQAVEEDVSTVVAPFSSHPIWGDVTAVTGLGADGLWGRVAGPDEPFEAVYHDARYKSRIWVFVQL